MSSLVLTSEQNEADFQAEVHFYFTDISTFLFPFGCDVSALKLQSSQISDKDYGHAAESLPEAAPLDDNS